MRQVSLLSLKTVPRQQVVYSSALMAQTVLVSFSLTNSPSDFFTVRQQLIPQSSGINYLPVACMISGAVIPKELYERQLRLVHSHHLAFGEDCRFIALIGSIAEDKQTAWYYWVVNRIDEDVAMADNWLKSTSAEERLDLAKKKCAGIDPAAPGGLGSDSAPGNGDVHPGPRSPAIRYSGRPHHITERRLPSDNLLQRRGREPRNARRAGPG
jgi:hypothetical protein